MSGDPRDYKLDIASLPGRAAEIGPTGRPFLGVLFECCGVYRRVYRDTSDAVYKSHCPKCGRRVQFRVSEEGTAARAFRVI